MQLIDTHCHLSFPPLAGDLQAVLARARAAGVQQIVVPAYDRASWPQVAALADGQSCFAALGLHPWVAHEPLERDDLAAALGRCRAVAIGEIGLDFVSEDPQPERQLELLRAQLELACDLDLPVILHCRAAFAELLELLASFSPRLRGVCHAFSKSPELAGRLLALGLHLGFGGAVTRPRARRAQAAVALVPAERLLLETDAPAIGLAGVPPEATEPRHIAEIAASVAALRQESLAAVARSTTENAQALFRLA